MILDASALLAYMYNEPGAEKVNPHLSGALVSTVNLSEVLTRLARDEKDTEIVLQAIEAVGIEVVPFSTRHAHFAARLIKDTARHGLSLADRACLALGIDSKQPVLTADRIWTKIRRSDLKIIVIH